MKGYIITALAITVMILSAGCETTNPGRQVGQPEVRVSQTRHSSQETLVIDPVADLSAYDSVDFRPLSSAVGDNISDELLDDLNRKIKDSLARKWLKKSGSRTLVVKGWVIHVSGSGRYMVVLVELYDMARGDSLGSANVAGAASGSATAEDAASGVASGVVRLLDEHGL